MSEVRVRIAPSPSGFLHVGTARTAVYNWLFARHHKGKFVLRIEDTDTARSSDDMVSSILESMKWLGLDWDEGPIYQSQRAEIHQSYARQLLETKKVYYCYCSPDLLRAKRTEAQKNKIAWKYDRTCLHLSPEKIAEHEKAGTPRALRLLVPEGKTVFTDIVYKELEIENKNLEDLILLRSDGRPTYNMACVADDLEMKISHIIRGNDHIPNTYKQVLIYQALGRPVPQFAHLPLILGMDRAKISKREQAVSVTDYREEGYLPEALVNFLALLGWSPKDGTEIMTRQELIEKFTLENVHQANPVFDLQKLEWMNGEYIRRKNADELFNLAKPYLVQSGLISEEKYTNDRARIQRILSLLQERSRTLTEFASTGGFFFKSDFEFDPKGVKKQFGSPEVAQRLAAIKEEYENLDGFSKDETESVLRMLAESMHLKPAELIHPIRLALTGMTFGPGLFDIVEVLGKEEVVRRLERAIEFINSLPKQQD